VGKREKHNPTLHMKVDKLQTKVDKLEVDVGWLKTGYWIQTLFAAGSFITVLGIALKYLEVI